MKTVVVSFVVLLLTISSSFSKTGFEGTLILEPTGCQEKGKCISKEALRFTDSNHVVWEAKAGLETDGASIPPIVQPIVGRPFDPQFIKPAIVHDHYCVRHVRTWPATHKVFYEGLIDQGVSRRKAKIMYYAVLLGGPKWIRLAPGNNCGKDCLNILGNAKGMALVVRQADYSVVTEADLKDIDEKLKANEDALTLEDLEKRAASKHRDDFFFKNKNGLSVNNDMVPELGKMKMLLE